MSRVGCTGGLTGLKHNLLVVRFDVAAEAPVGLVAAEWLLARREEWARLHVYGHGVHGLGGEAELDGGVVTALDRRLRNQTSQSVRAASR